jgi:DNA-binding NarL/FixJ family response regulator
MVGRQEVRAMIRVVIVDDHPLVRAGLACIVDAADDMVVVGDASDGSDGVAVVAETRPDVVLMDLSMPLMDGTEATRRIVRAGKGARVLVLTSFLATERLLPAVCAGAAGYLSKEVSAEALLTAIRSVADGDCVMDDCDDGDAGHGGAERLHLLSAPERQVLQLLATGKGARDISRELSISDGEVHDLLEASLIAMGASDRVGATLWARTHLLGLTDGSA